MGSGSVNPDDESDMGERANSSVGLGSDSGVSISQFSDDSSGVGRNSGLTTADREEISRQHEQGNFRRELNEHNLTADVIDYEYSVSDGPIEETPTPTEFARQALSKGARARHVRAGVDGHQLTNTGSGAEQVGTWVGFDSSYIESTTPLVDESDVAGRTATIMEVGTVTDDAPIAADEVYVTDYSEFAGKTMAPPGSQNALNQMASAAALDAMGVETPRHYFDAESTQVYVEGLGQQGREAYNLDSNDLPQEYVDRIDSDQMKDMMAANLVVGNADLTPDNLMVDEDGRVLTFDYDFVEDSATDPEMMRREKWVREGINKVRVQRDDDFDLTIDDVHDRARELATQLRESGTGDRVIAAAKEFDDYFENLDKSDFAVHSDVTPRSEVIANNINAWGNENAFYKD